MKYFNVNLLCLSIVSSMSASASEVTQEKELAIEERIIVTGSRIRESIDEVPASVSIINEKALLETMTVTTELQSILAIHVPGMGAETGKNSNSGQTLRGRKALVMIDGLPQSTPLRNGQLGIRSLDPSVIKRVEVIKGATSIYGNGAAGGIINYITKQATTDKSFAGNIHLGSSFSTTKLEDSISKRYDLSANGSFDNLDYYASAVFEDNGIIRDADGDALGLRYGLSGFESKNFFTKINYYFDQSRSLNFSYNYFEGQQKTDYYPINNDLNKGIKSYAIKNTDNLTQPGEPQGPRGNHNVRLQYQDTMLTDSTEFNADIYWQEIENVFFYSSKFKDPNLGLDGGQSLIKSNKKGLRFNFSTLFEFSSTDLSLVYGLDILNDITSQPLVDGRLWAPEMDMKNIAGYLQSKWTFNNDWIVKAGLRNERIDVDVEDFITLMLCRTSCTNSVMVEGGNLEYSSTTYNIGLRYAGAEMFSPFLSYSEGFDVSDLGALLRKTNAPNVNEISAEAATVKNSEVGFSSAINNVLLELSAFYSTSDLGSKIIKDPDTGVYLTGREPQKIWGYELSVNYQASSYLDMGFSYSWVEGKNKEDDTYIDGGSINPPKFTAFINYEITEDISVNSNIMHVSSRKRFDAVDGIFSGRTGPVSSYSVVNASAIYQFSNDIKLNLGIENLLNEDYFPHTSQSLSFNGFNVKGKGRTAKLSMSFAF